MFNAIQTFFDGLVANPETNLVFAFILALIGGGVAALINYLKATCC